MCFDIVISHSSRAASSALTKPHKMRLTLGPRGVVVIIVARRRHIGDGGADDRIRVAVEIGVVAGWMVICASLADQVGVRSGAAARRVRRCGRPEGSGRAASPACQNRRTSIAASRRSSKGFVAESMRGQKPYVLAETVRLAVADDQCSGVTRIAGFVKAGREPLSCCPVGRGV